MSKYLIKDLTEIVMQNKGECEKEARKRCKHHSKTHVFLPVKRDVDEIKRIVCEDHPVLIKILVYNFMKAVDDIVPIPNRSRDNFCGVHYACIVGWDDSKQIFIIANSWGVEVGKNGFFQIPYQYIMLKTLTLDLEYCP